MRVGAEPEVKEVEDDLKAYQALVGGYVEQVTLSNKLALVCDEEGRLTGKAFNGMVAGHDIRGDYFFIGLRGGNWRSLTEDEVKEVLSAT